MNKIAFPNDLLVQSKAHLLCTHCPSASLFLPLEPSLPSPTIPLVIGLVPKIRVGLEFVEEFQTSEIIALVIGFTQLTSDKYASAPLLERLPKL